MHDDVARLHGELDLKRPFLLVAEQRLTCDRAIRFDTARRIWRETLPRVISLMVRVLLRSALCVVHVLHLMDVHARWAHGACLLIQCGDQTGILLAYGRGNLSEIALGGAVGG